MKNKNSSAVSNEKLLENRNFEDLIKTYEPLLSSIVRRYAALAEITPQMSEFQDLRQEAEMALFKAYKTYDKEQKTVTFGAYAKVVIRNAVVSELRKINKRRKQDEKMMKQSKPLAKTKEEMDFSLLANSSFPLGKIMESLSTYEQEVFRLYVNGLKPREIARETNRPIKSVWNAVARFKAKAKMLLADYNVQTPKGF